MAVTRKTITHREGIDHGLGLCASSLCSNCFTSSYSFSASLIVNFHSLKGIVHG